MVEHVDWNDRYREGTTPWDEGDAAEQLVEVLPRLNLPNKNVLEIGCGTGTNAIFLAKKGFNIKATDISEIAIKSANDKSAKSGVPVDFEQSSILEKLPVAMHSAGFVFDRGVFHTMNAADRALFALRVSEALTDGGIWLSICGSADEKLPESAPGPPRLKASDIINATEALFELLQLDRTRITMPDKSERAAWTVLLRRR